MDYKSQTCCFTGHRDIAPYTLDTVFEQTKAVVTLLVSKGFKYFGTGGALGFDTIAAQAVLSVKETHPEINLILVLPCENQTKYWKQQDIDVYNDIKLRADKVKVLAPHYYNGCMQKRNRHLVDCSSACICFLTKHKGGTAYTVDSRVYFSTILLFFCISVCCGQTFNLLRFGYCILSHSHSILLEYLVYHMRVDFCGYRYVRVSHPFFCYIDWYSGCLTIGAEGVAQ